MTDAPTTGSIRATLHGLRHYLARLEDYLPPGVTPRPIDHEPGAHTKPKSQPNLNLDTFDLITHINGELNDLGRCARIALRILDGEGWERTTIPHTIALLVYAQALEGRDAITHRLIADTTDTLHAKAERYLGITDPPIPLDRSCPACGGLVLRAAREAVAWCTNKDWHRDNDVDGRWDGHTWLIAISS